MKIQTIKNKMYNQFEMKQDMVGRVFISEAINNSYQEGINDVIKIIDWQLENSILLGVEKRLLEKLKERLSQSSSKENLK